MTLGGCPLSIFCSRGTLPALSLSPLHRWTYGQGGGVRTGFGGPLGSATSTSSATAMLRSFFSLLLSSLELRDTKVYEPQMRALLGTASHFCKVVEVRFRAKRAPLKRLEGLLHIRQGQNLVVAVFCVPYSLNSGASPLSFFSSSALLLSNLKLSDTNVYEPSIRARLGNAAHLCEVVVLKLRTV